ncbi:MAG: phage tail protein [Pseudodesulfovibrio sp.]|uniref:phage tail protein n=1 Tax=Pseudodesulfovibrio sp. TaxID=2035812 RepID=UPI003D153069
MKISLVKNRFDKSGVETHVVETAGLSCADLFSLLFVGNDGEGLDKGNYSPSASKGGAVAWDYVPEPFEDVRFTRKMGMGGGMALLGGVMSMAFSGGGWVSFGIQLLVGVAVGLLGKLFAGSAKVADSFNSSPTYSWDSVGNPSSEGCVIPYVFGTHRVTGPIVHQWLDAQKKSGILESEYLNFVMAVSEGPVKSVYDLLVDGEPVEFFDDVEWEVRLGGLDQEPISGIDMVGSHYEPSGTVELKQNKPYVFRTHGEVDHFRLALSCPALFSMDDDGNIRSNAVEFRVRWADADGAFNDTDVETHVVSADTKAETIYHVYKEFDTSGQRKFEITRLTADFDKSSRREGRLRLKYWEELRHGTLTFPGTAYVFLRIRATDQLSGARPTISVMCEGKILSDIVKDDATGGIKLSPIDTVWSNNPAYLVADLLLDEERFGCGAVVAPDQIHYDSWVRFRDWCAETVTVTRYDENTGAWVTETQGRFPFNIVIDQQYVAWDLIQKIATTCDTFIFQAAGQLRFVPEAAYDGVPAQVFHDAKILVDGDGLTSLKETWDPPDKRPNELVVEFADAENDYERVSLRFVDHTRADEPRVSETLNLIGITDWRVIHRIANRTLRYAKCVGGSCEWDTGLEAVGCELGDVVLVAKNGANGWGGLVREIKPFPDLGGFEYAVAVLDREVYLEADRDYTVNLYQPGDAAASSSVTISVEESGWTNEIRVSGSSSVLDYPWGTTWTLSTVGGLLRPCRIIGTSLSSDDTVRLTAIEYDADVDVFDESITAAPDVGDQSAITGHEDAIAAGTTEPVRHPAHVQHTSPEKPPFVTSIAVTEETTARFGHVVTDLRVDFGTVTMPEGSITHIARYDVWYREQKEEKEGKWVQSGPCRGGEPYRIPAVKAGRTYEVVVCPVTSVDRSVRPAEAFAVLNGVITPSGKLPKIAAPAGVTVEHLADGRMRTSWTKCDGEAVRDYHLYLDGVVIAAVDHPVATAVTDGRLSAGTHILHVYPVDLTGRLGIPSETAVQIAAPAAPVVSASFVGQSVVLTLDGDAGTYAVRRWIVAENSGTVLDTCDGDENTLAIPADWTGRRVLVVYGEDIAGNRGDRTSVEVEIVAPGVVQNVVVSDDGIRWAPVETGSLPVTHYVVIDADTGDTVAETTGTYVPYQRSGRLLIYAVAGVNLLGTPRAVSVSRPAGFSLVTSYLSDWAGTGDNSVASGGSMYLPVDAESTWAEVFEAASADDMDDIAALADRYGRPGPASGNYVETIDLGRVYEPAEATEYQILLEWECHGETASTPDGLLTVEQSEDGATWATAATAAIAAGTASLVQSVPHDEPVRFVRLTVAAASTGEELWQFTSLGVDVLRATRKTLTGKVRVTVPANGAYVPIPDAVDIESVTATAKGGLWASYDYEDVENPGGVSLFVLNLLGERTVGEVSYTITYF